MHRDEIFKRVDFDFVHVRTIRPYSGSMSHTEHLVEVFEVSRGRGNTEALFEAAVAFALTGQMVIVIVLNKSLADIWRRQFHQQFPSVASLVRFEAVAYAGRSLRGGLDPNTPVLMDLSCLSPLYATLNLERERDQARSQAHQLQKAVLDLRRRVVRLESENAHFRAIQAKQAHLQRWIHALEEFDDLMS